MTCEAASELGIPTVVLAEGSPGDTVTPAAEVMSGVPGSRPDMQALAGRCDVVTFDHEQVDLTVLSELVAEGHVVHPGVTTLEMAVDKSVMRARLAGAGIDVPAFALVPPTGAVAAVAAFADDHGWPVVVKATRGGYDGKGVWPVDGPDAVARVCERAAADGVTLLVEEMVPIEMELAAIVARRPGGEAAAWPAVETAQIDGVCREVLSPGRLAVEIGDAAGKLAHRVAEVAGSVGVLAVEMFWTGNRLLVNEVAARPHNSGHWTIEGAVTSQFEGHLRAVLDLPLGSTGATAPQVASVNVFGAADGSDPAAGLARALAVEGAHVHLYGKEPRPGRKLGHVTVCGDQAGDVRGRAWAAARALGTPVPASLEIPESP
jgi:5-(carboxyamino)imidazole ribonucleotide synthase